MHGWLPKGPILGVWGVSAPPQPCWCRRLIIVCVLRAGLSVRDKARRDCSVTQQAGVLR